MVRPFRLRAKRAGRLRPGVWLPGIRLPAIWLLLFVLTALLAVLKVSFSEPAVGMPPYRPLFTGVDFITERLRQFSVDNYLNLFTGSDYPAAYASAFFMAGLSTFTALLIGYPVAYAMSRAPARMRRILLLTVLLCFCLSMLIRTYLWIDIFDPDAWLYRVLPRSGLMALPDLLDTRFAVIIALVYCYLPLMILPLYVALMRIDRTVLDAATDLGAGRSRQFWTLVLPLTRRGIVLGSLLVFIPSAGNFIVPHLLGGDGAMMAGTLIWADFANRAWPMASSAAIVLLVLLAAPYILFARDLDGKPEADR